MRILHLSADYPDPLVPAKTRAVAALLELAPGHRHVVYSLNRVGWRLNWRGGIHALGFADRAGEEHRAVAYGAPGKGLLLRTRLRALADRILADIAARGQAFDLVHAHKLSVEGLAGARIAAALGLPLAVSVQGDSDLKIVGARPDLRPVWARIWREAAVAFPFAPWAAAALDARLGARTRPVLPLPCPVAAARPLAPRPGAGPLVRSAFHLAAAGRKNAAGLISAVGLAAREIPDIRLEIAGGGDAAAFARLAALAEAAAPGRVRFTGALPGAAMPLFLNGAGCFALVSHRESFGMVFAEALLAGTPCLIPRGRAIAGYLPEGGVLLAADPADPGAIAAGLVALLRDEAGFKARLAALQAAGGLDIFGSAAIAATYERGLASIRPARQESLQNPVELAPDSV
jgi:glycosyltransferase involved in cell wall biosynthesis